MFTPNRHAGGGSAKSRRRMSGTPRSQLQSASKHNLRRRSMLQGRSPNVSLSATNSPTLNMTMNIASGEHIVTSFGSSLPVKIMEVLNLAEDYEDIDVEINENGWAWLLHEQKVFAWRFKQSVSKILLCKEFSLPKLDTPGLKFVCKLVCIKCNPSRDDEVSMLSVSPEGHVSYWPSIVHNSEFVVTSMLDGLYPVSSVENRCIKVVNLISTQSFAALSSKGTIYIIHPGKNSIQYTKVQQNSGLLAGIGRRMSSFFFSPSDVPEAIDIICLKNNKSKEFSEVVILTKTHLQKWSLTNDQSGLNEMVSHVALNTTILEDLSNSIWQKQIPSLQYWPLQLALSSSNNQFMILLAATNSSQSQNIPVRFGLIVCNQSIFQESRAVNIIPLEHLQLLTDEDQEIDYQLIIPKNQEKAPKYGIVSSKNFIIIKSFVGENVENKIPFDSTGDSILGIGKFQDQCVLFSAMNCLVSIKENMHNTHLQLSDSFVHGSSFPSPTQSSFNDSSSSFAEVPSLVKTDLLSMENHSDCTQRLQAAFIYYNKKDMHRSKEIVSETFDRDFDHTLDKSVITISQNLIDDYPARDPRWAETIPENSAGSSNSLLLQHQLKDKAQAHDLYLRFLSDVNIMDRLTTISAGIGKPATCTKWILFEHGEKLAAANALRQQHSVYQNIVDMSIKNILKTRNVDMDSTGLTQRDIFYREVSKVDEIISTLVNKEEQMIKNSLLSSQDIFMTIVSVNDILYSMLSAANEYRKLKQQNCFIEIVSDKQCEYIPWTVQGDYDIRQLTVRQHKVTLEKGIPESQDGQQRATFHSNLVQLSDLVLNEYLNQITSLSKNEILSERLAKVQNDFVLIKKQLISPLLDLNLSEKAAYLGEKYHDYGILIGLCNKQDDQSKLSYYINKFSKDGFCEFLFQWYLDRGMIEELLQCAKNDAVAAPNNMEKLSGFLQKHPTIAWHHQIQSDQFSNAYDTLRYLSEVENDSALKKRQYLSLGKMACLFSDDSEEIIEEKAAILDMESTILRYQETLPQEVLRKFEYDIDTMPVLDIKRLIQMYIGDENVNSNEVDFKKALELLQFISDEGKDDLLDDIEALKVLIWCRVILKNSWEGIDHSSHLLHACSHTLLFKLLQLVHESDTVEECVPNVEEILEHMELGVLRESSSFQFLIRAIFEEFNRTVSMMVS